MYSICPRSPIPNDVNNRYPLLFLHTGYDTLTSARRVLFANKSGSIEPLRQKLRVYLRTRKWGDLMGGKAAIKTEKGGSERWVIMSNLESIYKCME